MSLSREEHTRKVLLQVVATWYLNWWNIEGWNSAKIFTYSGSSAFWQLNGGGGGTATLPSRRTDPIWRQLICQLIISPRVDKAWLGKQSLVASLLKQQGEIKQSIRPVKLSKVRKQAMSFILYVAIQKSMQAINSLWHWTCYAEYQFTPDNHCEYIPVQCM